MKVITANGKKKIIITRKEWEAIGKKAGWEDSVMGLTPADESAPYKTTEPVETEQHKAIDKTIDEAAAEAKAEAAPVNEAGVWPDRPKRSLLKAHLANALSYIDDKVEAAMSGDALSTMESLLAEIQSKIISKVDDGDLSLIGVKETESVGNEDVILTKIARKVMGRVREAADLGLKMKNALVELSDKYPWADPDNTIMAALKVKVLTSSHG